jgi:hypothetical protein
MMVRALHGRARAGEVNADGSRERLIDFKAPTPCYRDAKGMIVVFLYLIGVPLGIAFAISSQNLDSFGPS